MVYRKKFGEITAENVEEYLKWTRRRGKMALDRLQKEGYNISDISRYANDNLIKQNFDEAYTEYRTLCMLGGN